MTGTLRGETVLVTGATGFLGGALALRLAAEGVQVRALARTPEKGAFLCESAHADRIEIVQGDILDADRLYISSIAVYGYEHRADVTEDMGPTPATDAYSTTKAEAEAVVREEGAARDVSYTIIRPGAIYGPRSGAWTGRVFRMAVRRPTVFIGSGRGASPAVHVDDVIALCLITAVHPAAHAEAFNATPDPPPTWRAVLDGYARLADRRLWWVGVPLWLVKLIAPVVARVVVQDGMVKRASQMVDYLDSPVTYRTTKARDLLGWEPQIDLDTGIRSCAPWLRAQGWLA
jgi:nucleoside-diphosphate-sugar epimerase